MAEKNLNRIKVMLAEKGKKNKWLAEKLGRDQATISKWCTNACQPPLEAGQTHQIELPVNSLSK